ncbi:signal peptidase II [Loktanella sp. DSM 29012]|uniref:Lipoprotein signal peptidase n=1 Tax=Loktanella gaetbuli TaxID=2881335 RepID=A0ABS8BUH6_9RHOB|nr:MULTISPECIES: signal peptidase II [Loktanella]MCB5199389.1 signal peptidase II [Loktanella gaetbuli]SEP56290.1 signal peptidase II [Loktanella sp. DSM 29012]
MRLVFWAGFWTFLLDQATKYAIVHWLDLMTRQRIEVFPPFLVFQMAWNRGVNFGLGAQADMRWVLIGVALAISVGVLVWLWRSGGTKWMYIAAGLLVGGALGNVVDRVLYGAVADFLNMSCCGFSNPYAFNIADIAIFAGAIGLAFLPGPDARQTKARKGA